MVVLAQHLGLLLVSEALEGQMLGGLVQLPRQQHVLHHIHLRVRSKQQIHTRQLREQPWLKT